MVIYKRVITSSLAYNGGFRSKRMQRRVEIIRIIVKDFMVGTNIYTH